MGKDQLLGEVKIKISDVMKTESKKITNWYKLVGGDGNVGDVLLTLQLRGESPRWLRTMESKEKARMSRILAKQSEANLLERVVNSARSLLGDRSLNEPDLEDDITSMKPYCSIRVDNCDEKGRCIFFFFHLKKNLQNPTHSQFINRDDLYVQNIELHEQDGCVSRHLQLATTISVCVL